MKTISYFKGRKAFWCLIFFSVPQLYSHVYAGTAVSYAFIQQINIITGTVSDASSTLPGVSISIKGKSGSVLSDGKGNFRIEAEQGDILLFSFIGYTDQEIQVGSRTSISIVLKAGSLNIQEVTINAGYYSVTDRERTGSIAKVKKDDIEQQPVSNPLGALQGRMSGVQITQAAGTPGSGFSIQIRGTGSLRSEGNDPLYVVNGVPYASQPMGSNAVSGSGFGGLSSPLSNINPADIESIEVLKDADATAIYGSRGANGVVLITTKKGKSGKNSFELQAYTSLGKITRKLDVLGTEDYLALRREAFANDGITEYPAIV